MLLTTLNPLRHLTRHNQSRFIHNLESELLNHINNLTRALNGTSVFYVPNTEQRANIGDEQVRLNSMLIGVKALTRIWRITAKPGRQISANTKRLLTTSASTDSAATINAGATMPPALTGYDETDIMGLEDLFHYLDAQVCFYEQLGRACPSYASLSKEIGYRYGGDSH